MTMTLQPRRDGALENDIVIHEYTHGITNRMTGGGTGRCLQTTEAGGMGEGWSDAMAEYVCYHRFLCHIFLMNSSCSWTEQTSNIRDYIMGQWVTNDSAGIRSRPYSTSSYVLGVF